MNASEYFEVCFGDLNEVRLSEQNRFKRMPSWLNKKQNNLLRSGRYAKPIQINGQTIRVYSK